MTTPGESWASEDGSVLPVREDRSGLLNATGLVFDVADHVLSGHFGHHPETYQGSLDGLHQEAVISSELHERLQGLGGFRNLLVHVYLELDPAEVLGHLRKAFGVFPVFAREILGWMEGLPGSEESEGD